MKNPPDVRIQGTCQPPGRYLDTQGFTQPTCPDRKGGALVEAEGAAARADFGGVRVAEASQLPTLDRSSGSAPSRSSTV